MLTFHQWHSLAFTWEQFHSDTQATILYNEFESHTFIVIATTPMGYWVNTLSSSIIFKVLLILIIIGSIMVDCMFGATTSSELFLTSCNWTLKDWAYVKIESK